MQPKNLQRLIFILKQGTLRCPRGKITLKISHINQLVFAILKEKQPWMNPASFLGFSTWIMQVYSLVIHFLTSGECVFWIWVGGEHIFFSLLPSFNLMHSFLHYHSVPAFIVSDTTAKSFSHLFEKVTFQFTFATARYDLSGMVTFVIFLLIHCSLALWWNMPML